MRSNDDTISVLFVVCTYQFRSSSLLRCPISGTSACNQRIIGTSAQKRSGLKVRGPSYETTGDGAFHASPEDNEDSEVTSRLRRRGNAEVETATEPWPSAPSIQRPDCRIYTDSARQSQDSFLPPKRYLQC